jgi:hypothetical protein
MPLPVPVPGTIEHLRALIDRVNMVNPSIEDRQALQRFLRDNPDVVRRFHGGVEGVIRYAALSSLVQNVAFEELILHGARKLRKELGIQTATPIERVLIENVVTAWVVLQATEVRCATCETGKPAPMPQALYWDRKRTAAHKRFNKAMETLARVRRLQAPALQVNIGTNQINVSQ